VSGPRAALTLFEVLIAALVVSIAAITTIALLPTGVKAQQTARYQIYASAAAISLMDSFHSMITNLDGIAPLTPSYLGPSDVDPTQAAPPYTGWANQLRSSIIHQSAYAPDFERYLCGWNTGLLPVPPEIARRLDSDGDEIRKVLDEGGQLYYLHPTFVRGLGFTADADPAVAVNPTPEIQNLVVAVRGYAQQNSLNSLPTESWPWYETYPFPPEFVFMQMHGGEVRNVTRLATPKTGDDVYNLENERMRPQDNRMGVYFADAGHRRFAVRWSKPFRCYQERWPGALRQDQWGNRSNAPPMQHADYPIDGPDRNCNWAQVGGDMDPNRAGNGWYHGRNWRYFAELHRADPSDPWVRGWLAFQRLAGFDDSMRDKKRQTQYCAGLAGDATKHYTDPRDQTAGFAVYHRSGWLPVLGMITNPFKGAQPWIGGGDPWDTFYTAPAGNPLAAPAPGSAGNGWPSGAFPARDDSGQPNLNNANDIGERVRYIRRLTEAPPVVENLAPTYEMRANYRDRAIALWNAVKPAALPALALEPRAEVRDLEGGTMLDCDTVECPPLQLDRFIFADPAGLPAAAYPPHPAQVMALSYLAHAAMTVTGYDPPFVKQSVECDSTDTRRSKYPWYLVNWCEGAMPPEGTSPVELPKDALMVVGSSSGADEVPAGSTTFRVRNDSNRRFMLHPGDEIMVQDDYERWERQWDADQSWDRTRPMPRLPRYTVQKAVFWAPEIEDEDRNGNGVLDPGEDLNGNGRLDRIDQDLDGSIANVDRNGNGMLDPEDTDASNTIDPGEDQDGDGRIAPYWMEVTVSPALLGLAWKDGAKSFSGLDLDGKPAVATRKGKFIRRVANEHDRAFARTVHEMCLRWATAYASENAYDFGAPRPANHQLSTDKPLAMYDLFYDAGRGGASGDAVRTPQHLPDPAGRQWARSDESFYRWIMPDNPAAGSWFTPGQQADRVTHAPSNFGPGVSPTNFWRNMVYNEQLKPPGMPTGTAPGQQGSDEERYTLNRPFSPFHRARELKFWAVDWKSYADAEQAPCAPMDAAKIPRNIDSWGGSLRMTRLGDPPSGASTLPGPPENDFLWTDATRRTRWIDVATKETSTGEIWKSTSGANVQAYVSSQADADIVLGHWGADRNGNGRFDIGPIPPGARLRAQMVGRFLFYDPVIRLNVGN
jgi:hypothetical protein